VPAPPSEPTCLDAALARLAALPKAELHVHLEGSVSPERAACWAGASAGAVRARWDAIASMDAFVAAYVDLMRLFDRPDRFVEAASDLAARLAPAGFVRAEVTVTAAVYTAHFRTVDEGALAEALVEGRRRARERGVDMAFVPDAVRTLPQTVAPTLAFARRLSTLDPGALAGVGLAGDERAGPAGEAALALARDLPPAVAFLPHAGEHGSAAAIRWALAHGARRIGHGIAVLHDPALVAQARDRGVAFEVCPDSNVRLRAVPSAQAHPMAALFDAGLRVVPCTDDPGIFGLDPLASYRFALRQGVPEATLARAARTSLLAAAGPFDPRPFLEVHDGTAPDP